MTLEEAAARLWVLHHRFMAQSGFEVGSTEDMRFNALAMCGEAGEVANVIKKGWRGDELKKNDLRDELGDVFSYWTHLVTCAGFTFEEVATRAVRKAGFYIDELEERRGNSTKAVDKKQ